jgi:hypothetical protein
MVLSDKDKKIALAVFKQGDVSGNGTLSGAEVQAILDTLTKDNATFRQRKPTVESVVQQFDIDKSGEIDEKEFLTFYEEMLKQAAATKEEEKKKQEALTNGAKGTPGAVYEIHFMEAPLMKSQFGDRLAKLDMYHSGLRFINKSAANDQFDVDFCAEDFMGSLTPVPAADGSLEWKDQATTFINPQPPSGYWSKDAVVGEVEGSQLDKYFDWARAFNKAQGWYLLWQLQSTPEREQPEINSHNCFDFVEESLRQLRAAGGKLNEPLGCHKTIVKLFGAQTKVDASDPNNLAKLAAFYSALGQQYLILKSSVPTLSAVSFARPTVSPASQADNPFPDLSPENLTPEKLAEISTSLTEDHRLQLLGKFLLWRDTTQKCFKDGSYVFYRPENSYYHLDPSDNPPRPSYVNLDHV